MHYTFKLCFTCHRAFDALCVRISLDWDCCKVFFDLVELYAVGISSQGTAAPHHDCCHPSWALTKAATSGRLVLT
jgi:hypothetical protein